MIATSRVLRLVLPLSCIVASVASGALAADAARELSTPARAVESFYTYHLANDMGFTQKNVEARRKWLAPELVALCQSYFARPTSSDEAPLVNGDPFSNSQEYPKSFNLTNTELGGQNARVTVKLKGDGYEKKMLVDVVRMRDEWRIIDVREQEQQSLRTLLTTKP